jgi:hypothetical protein
MAEKLFTRLSRLEQIDKEISENKKKSEESARQFELVIKQWDEEDQKNEEEQNILSKLKTNNNEISGKNI